MQSPTEFRHPDALAVLHVNTNTNWGGGENQVFHLLKGLVASGVRVHLLAPDGAPLLNRCRDEGIPAQALPRSRRARRQLLKALLQTWPPDLLHLHDSGAIQCAAAAARRQNIPVIFSRRVASPLRKNFLSRRKYSPANLTAVLAISQTVKEVMAGSGYPDERIFVAPSGLPFDELDRVAPLPEFAAKLGGRFLVGGLGALTPKKNWQLLIQVAAEPVLRDLDIHWVIAGRGNDRQNLLTQAYTLEVEDRLHFLGFRNDSLQVLKSLDALFFPSLMEGASVTVREAMAMEVPVIIHNTPGCLESLGGHGWVVDQNDIEEAAEVVKHVLLNETERNRTLAAARASARTRFSFEQTLSDTLAAYAAVRAGL